MLETSEPLLIDENMDAEAERYGSPTISGTEDTKSLLFVPLVTGGKATGVISLENIDASTPSASPTSSCWRRWPAA